MEKAKDNGENGQNSVTIRRNGKVIEIDIG